jgi:hypothetical protein
MARSRGLGDVYKRQVQVRELSSGQSRYEFLLNL